MVKENRERAIIGFGMDRYLEALIQDTDQFKPAIAGECGGETGR
jgi:hypothetical protein